MRIYLNEAGKCPNNATNSAKNHAILLVVLTGRYLAHFHKWTDTCYIVFWGLTVLNHASAENDSIPRWEEKWLVKEQYENFLSKWDNPEEWESYQVPPYCLLGVVISTECVKRRRTEGGTPFACSHGITCPQPISKLDLWPQLYPFSVHFFLCP